MGRREFGTYTKLLALECFAMVYLVLWLEMCGVWKILVRV